LADAAARFEARHRSLKDLRPRVEEVREVWRRSGGRTAKLGTKELAALFREQLRGVRSFEEFRAAPLAVDVDKLVPPAERARWLALPDSVTIRDREVPIEYGVEDSVGGIARLRLPEKMARTLVDAELPTLDRPVRFIVTRGQRGAVRASTLEELQDLLDRPWAPDEELPERYREDRNVRRARHGVEQGRQRERGGRRSRRRRR
jgi:ATP-dependent helicase HrpA